MQMMGQKTGGSYTLVEEFLTSLLETSGRASDLLHRSRHPPERDAELRAQLRKQLLQAGSCQFTNSAHCGVTDRPFCGANPPTGVEHTEYVGC